jgi:tetratricopeptide (TPR) repeat protein
VFYCSAEHQEQHWDFHSSECVFEEAPVQSEEEEQVFEDTQPFEPDPNASLLADETVYQTRFTIRKAALISLIQGEVSNALESLKPHYQHTVTEYDRNHFFDIYDLLADGLLYTKALVQADELVPARQVLLQLYTRMVQNEDTHKAAQQAVFRLDEGKGEKQVLTFTQLKRKLTAYSAIGTLFCVCGDYVNGEKIYLQYTKVIEMQFGLNSLETSNAYFLIGLFYQEQVYPARAIACFRRAMEIRIEGLGSEHETVADCLYNIGLVYKQIGSWNKSAEQLLKSLKIREKNTSPHSLPVAQVLEALGKVQMAVKDYKSAFEKLTQCYNIRKRLLKNPENEQIERVKTLLVRLSQALDDEMAKDQSKRIEMSLFNPIATPELSPMKTDPAYRQPLDSTLMPTSSDPVLESIAASESPSTEPATTSPWSYSQRAAPKVTTPPSTSDLHGRMYAGLEEREEQLGLDEGK